MSCGITNTELLSKVKKLLGKLTKEQKIDILSQFAEQRDESIINSIREEMREWTIEEHTVEDIDYDKCWLRINITIDVPKQISISLSDEDLENLLDMIRSYRT
jgi:predicted CopG family antitoxin